MSSLPPPGPTARLPAFSETEEPGKSQETSCFLLSVLLGFLFGRIFSFLNVCFDVAEKKKRKTRGDHFKQRFRKNFTALLEEEVGLCWFRPSLLVCLLGLTPPFCALIGRTCQSDLSPTTCPQRPRPPRFPPDTSAVSVATLLTTPAPPVGGATAAASVCAHTGRPGPCS